MNTTAELLDRVVADLDQVLSADALFTMTDAEKLDVLRVAGNAFRRVEAVIVETVATTDTVAIPTGYGCRNMNELLQRSLRVDASGAARITKAAKLVTQDTGLTTGAPLPARWPALREAMREGSIGIAGLLAATGPIEQSGDRISTADRLRADTELAAQARGCTLADADADTDAGEMTRPRHRKICGSSRN